VPSDRARPGQRDLGDSGRANENAPRAPRPARGAVVKLLRDLPRESNFVFPGRAARRRFPTWRCSLCFERMGRSDVTVHGFRSSFRDWCAERTSYPNHVVEMALAHAIGDDVEAAYRRGDLFDKRRKLMVAGRAT